MKKLFQTLALALALVVGLLSAGIAPAGCTSTTCTLNNNATTSTAGNATVFPYGNGCGFGTSCSSPSTTFNMPDCRDVVFAGRGNMGGTARSDNYQLSSTYFGASPNALGVFGGSQSHALSVTEMPSHQHNVYLHDPGHNHSADGQLGNAAQAAPQPGNNFVIQASTVTGTSTTGITIGSVNGTANDNQTAATGGGSAHSIVQPTFTLNCMVRVLAMSLPVNDNWNAIRRENAGRDPAAVRLARDDSEGLGELR